MYVFVHVCFVHAYLRVCRERKRGGQGLCVHMNTCGRVCVSLCVRGRGRVCRCACVCARMCVGVCVYLRTHT